MIPVVNHGRRTGNPEPGLLRHVLFLVITLLFHLSTVAYIFYMYVICHNYIISYLYYLTTFQIHNGVDKVLRCYSKVDAPQSVSGLNDSPVHGEQGAQSPGLLISPVNHLAGSYGIKYPFK